MLERCAWSRSKLGKRPYRNIPWLGHLGYAMCSETKPDPVLEFNAPPWLGPLAVGVGAVGLGALDRWCTGGLPGAAAGALSAM